MRKPHDERKSLRKDALTLFAGGMGESIFATIEVIFLARFLGLEQFGLFSLVVSYVGFVNLLVDFRIGDASVKYVSEYLERGDRESVRSFVKFFYLIDFFSGLLAFCVCIAFAGIANELFIKSEDSFQYVIILSFALFVSTVNQNSHAILQSLRNFKQSGFFKSFHSAMRLVLIAAAYFAGFGLKGFFAAYVIAAGVNFAILQYSVNKVLKEKMLGGYLFADLGKIRGQMREAVWFMFNTGISGFISLSFSAHVPVLILGYFYGTDASGLYKVARNVVKIAEKIIGPVSSVVYPAMVRIKERGAYDEFTKVIVYSVKQIMKFLFPISFVLFVFAEKLIEILFGGEFMPAADTMRVFVVHMIFTGLLFWWGNAFQALGMPGARTVLLLFSGAAMFAGFFFLVPSYSYFGAALAVLIQVPISLAIAVFLSFNLRHRSALP